MFDGFLLVLLLWFMMKCVFCWICWFDWRNWNIFVIVLNFCLYWRKEIVKWFWWCVFIRGCWLYRFCWFCLVNYRLSFVFWIMFCDMCVESWLVFMMLRIVLICCNCLWWLMFLRWVDWILFVFRFCWIGIIGIRIGWFGSLYWSM